MQLRSRQTNARALYAAGTILCFSTFYLFPIRGRGSEASFDDKRVDVGRYFARRQAATGCFSNVLQRATANVSRLLRQDAGAHRGIEELNGELADRHGSALGRELVFLCDLVCNGYDACVLRGYSYESEWYTTYGLTLHGDVSWLLLAPLEVFRFREGGFGANVAKYSFHRRLSDVKFVIFSACGDLVSFRHLRRGDRPCRCLLNVFRRRLVINYRMEFALCDISGRTFYFG